MRNGNITVVKYTTETIVKEEDTFMQADLGLAKDLYREIMYFKYGEDGLYKNSSALSERLRENKGKIEKHELDEYMMLCKNK